ncbi:MAG: glycosyltransferase [Acidimicrobiales bacterium]
MLTRPDELTVPARPAPRPAPWTLVGTVGVLVLAVAVAGMQIVVSVAAILVEAIFVAYFLRHLAFALSAFRTAQADLSAPLVEMGYQPALSVMVACKNEAAVAHRLVENLLGLDYPSELLQLLVVDDASSDGTGEILDGLARDSALVVLHRHSDSGGKSGALNYGLERATGEIVVVFDADHCPHRDVLRRLVRHFEEPSVAAVQGRCEISNTEDSPLTELVGIDYLAGYLVNEYGRQALFSLPAYGGANCAVRTDVLTSIGGWNTASVTEDTDLTIRVLLAGYRVRYDITAVDEEEGVTTVAAYWRQRYRWARGHQQVWRDYHWPIWRSRRFSLAQKIESTMFLLAFHLPVISGLGLVIALTWLGGLARAPFQVDLFVLWMLLFLGPLVELGGGLLLARADRSRVRALIYFLPLYFVSIGLCTKAWVDGLFGRDYVWAKTRRVGELVERGVASPTAGE